MGLPLRVIIPIVTIFAVVFLGIMGYFLKIGFGTAGSAFGPGSQPHEQGDARIAATAAPDVPPTDPPGTVDIPQSGTGPSNGAGQPPGNLTGGGGPPAPVMQMLADLRARIAKNPRDIAAIVQLGDLYSDAGKYDQATTYYERALALDPKNPDVRDEEAAALHAGGHDLEALREVNRVLTDRPNFAQALLNRAVVLRAMGRHEDALRAYKQFLKAAPNDRHANDARAAIKELGA